ncbi:TolC family protein [Porphyromonas gingivalis]|uniref:TolC family protein n=1 Tax=Porphyromonas gingivalis TaxID=837 RepID=UPI000C195859|nr:TolC family protein [Porphyromonas gingivalis]ATR99612.1 hypothetical protein CS549_00020 [Porphyromonas gingivalis]
MNKLLIIIVLLFFSLPGISQEWTLENCILYAKKNNKELVEKLTANKISKIEETIEYTELFPKMFLDFSTDHYWKIPVESYPAELLGGEEGTTVKIPIGTPWMSSYRVGMSWKIFDIEAINKIKLSVLLKKSSETKTSIFLKIIKKNVTLAFYSTQIYREKMNLAKKQLDDYNLIHNLVFEQFKNGLIDKIVYNQSKNILINCQSHYLLDEQKYQASLLNLKFWMGYPLLKEIIIPENYNIPVYLSQASFTYEQLPEYKEYENEILISKQYRKIAMSSLSPKVSLNGSYGQKGFGATPSELLGNKWYPSGYIGISINFPLFSMKDIRIINKHNTTIQHKIFRMNSYLETQKKEFLSVSMKLKNSWKKIKLKREQYKNSEESLLLSIEKVKEGIIDLTLLQSIQSEFFARKDELYNSYIEYMKHYIDVKYLQEYE